ncbi:MAG: hypothetical protein VYE15_02630 [Myxococcota bacterium]|nr:hypothetical protein [Myxococcota bacterium]
MRPSPPVALVLCVLLWAGCLPDVSEWSGELLDPLKGLGYENGFELDPSCELTGELDVEIGTGELVFESITEGHRFHVVYGPQGGSHVFGALRLNNPALEFPRLEVVFQLLDDDACIEMEERGDFYRSAEGDSHWEFPAWAYTEEERARDCWPVVAGFRHGLIREPWQINSDGGVEAAGIFVFHRYYGGGGANRARLSVRDPCGRVGTAEVSIVD